MDTYESLHKQAIQCIDNLFNMIKLRVVLICILYRCDQYRWVHQGTQSFYFRKFEMKRKTSAIDVNGGDKTSGGNRFKRLKALNRLLDIILLSYYLSQLLQVLD